MTEYLFMGIVLGLSAGLAPGPLLTLVLSETLQYGVQSGMKVALAPVITDLPIILITFFILAKLSSFQDVLGVVSLVGGGFLLLMAWETLRTKKVEIDTQSEKPRSLSKGVLANALNPHPYLFWFSVGAPTMLR